MACSGIAMRVAAGFAGWYSVVSFLTKQCGLIGLPADLHLQAQVSIFDKYCVTWRGLGNRSFDCPFFLPRRCE